jgi:hypothetical protein
MQAANLGGGNAAVVLGKALENPIKNVNALKKAGIEFTDEEKAKIQALAESNDLLGAQEIILGAVEKKVGGVAAATADDTEKMKEAFNQVQQSIGLSLLPILEAVTPLFLGFANWAKENPGTFKTIAAAIGAISAAILFLNFVISANPITLIGLAIAAVVAGLILAYKRFESFRKIVDGVFKGIKFGFEILKTYLETLLSVYKGIFNGFASIWNNTIGKISIKIPDIVGLPGRGKEFSVPRIPALANGGIVQARPGGTLALIGEGGRDEAVIPLDRAGNLGGGNTFIIQGAIDPVSTARQIERILAGQTSRFGY